MATTYFEYVIGERLQERLDVLAAKTHLSFVEVSVWVNGIIRHAAAGYSGTGAGRSAASARIGCLAKSLTAMLTALASAEGLLTLSDSASRFFEGEISSELYSALAPILVRDLLNHTHGIDDSNVSALMHCPNGFIDFQALLGSLLSAPRLAAPGIHFCYGNGGVWIAAAILERVYRLRFAQVLRRRLLRPLRIEAGISSQTLGAMDSLFKICPANGGDLRMNARDLLRVAASHLANDSSTLSTGERESIRRLREWAFTPRGWQPKIRRVCLGIHDMGDDWFGHNARFNGDSALFRFSPSRNIAASVVANREEAAYQVFALLFGSLHAELAGASMPRVLNAATWAKSRVDNYIGAFDNAAMRVEIAPSAANQLLVARVYSRAGQGYSAEPVIKCRLLPAENDVFFSIPQEASVVPFMQFLDRANNGEFRYLQTGRRLFARSR